MKQPATNSTQGDWGKVEDREKATDLFTDFLVKLGPEDRKIYIYDPDNPSSDATKNAKAKFRELGNFPEQGEGAIPDKTVFQVYEYDPKDKRDRLVTMVLPDPKKPRAVRRATDVWLCTWPPYRT